MGEIERPPMSYRLIITIIVIMVILITALYINFFILPEKSDSQKKPPPVGEENRILPPETEGEEKPVPHLPVLPKLQDSDELMRELLKTYSGQTIIRKWLAGKDIIRRLVAFVDSIARGDIPSPELTYQYPDKPFNVIEKANRIVLDPGNHNRYNPLIKMLTALDTSGIKDLFDRIHPLLEEAHKELGYPEEKFNDALLQAFQVILDTPVILPPVYLEHQVINYSFRNPRLEKLLPVQKMIVRTGPDNTRLIQKKCRTIINQLNLGNR